MKRHYSFSHDYLQELVIKFYPKNCWSLIHQYHFLPQYKWLKGANVPTDEVAHARKLSKIATSHLSDFAWTECPAEVNFAWPYRLFGRKLTSGQLLFPALGHASHFCAQDIYSLGFP